MKWKSILLLTLVFATGLIAGVAGTRAVARRMTDEAVTHPEHAQMVLERNLTRRLWLDQDQQAQLHGIMTDARGQIVVLRQQYQPQIQTIYLQTDSRIEAMLRRGQLERYEKIRQEQRTLFRPLRQGPLRKN
jgi:hypothetical protein